MGALAGNDTLLGDLSATQIRNCAVPGHTDRDGHDRLFNSLLFAEHTLPGIQCVSTLPGFGSHYRRGRNRVVVGGHISFVASGRLYRAYLVLIISMALACHRFATH